MNSSIRILSISDIHLFHTKNETQYILDNLNKYFSNDEVLCQYELVIFAGDVFDSLVALSDNDVRLVDIWISKFLRICHKFNIVVRVLEGTPSHDRKQSDRFKIVNEINYYPDNIKVDLEYAKTLSIEHIGKFGIDVLYVPDEWNHDTETTLMQVKELLAVKRLKHVDIAIMHGLFEFQMGDVVKANVKHKSQEYLKIVKGLIFIGHIHKHSFMDRIYAQGSFDRLAHGEEEKKGYLSAVLNTDYSFTVNFIENKNARKYITVKCTHDDIEYNIKKIDKVVKSLPDHSFVRISSTSTNPIITNQDLFKRRWPMIHWAMHTKDKDEEENKPLLINDDIEYVPMLLSKETLPVLIADRLKKLNVSIDTLDRSKLHLESLL